MKSTTNQSLTLCTISLGTQCVQSYQGRREGGRDTIFLERIGRMGGWDGPSSSVWQWPVERMRPNRSCHSICDPHPCSIAPLLLQEQNWATEKWAKGNVLTNQIDDSLAKSRATKRPNVWVERHFLEPMPSLNHPICMNMALWKSARVLSNMVWSTANWRHGWHQV